MSQFLESDRNCTVNLRCVKVKWRHQCLKSKQTFFLSVSEIQNAGENVEKLELLYTSRGSMNWYNHFGKPAISPKADHTHTLWSSHSTPRYKFNRNAYVWYSKWHISLCIAALFLMASKCKWSKCSATVEWISSSKRPWCWDRLGAGGKGDDRGWDGWMASPTWWTWVWVDSRSWWWTGRPGVQRFMGSQRVGHDWVTELNWLMVTQWNTVLERMNKLNTSMWVNLINIMFIKRSQIQCTM